MDGCTSGNSLIILLLHIITIIRQVFPLVLWVDILLLLKALGSSFIVGLLFAALKLPIPAPPALAGIMGIVGIYLGFILWQKFF